MALHELSASEVAGLLARREVSSVEVVRALCARATVVEPRVHAWVHRFDEVALAEAEKVDRARAAGEKLGPLAGLPISVKENVATAGVAATLGLKSRLGELSARDAVTVALAKRAGAIVLGKTNVPQTLLAMETTNFIWGTTNNPWAAGRVPGGSSGGEAAAIASGSSLCGIGTDIGGSIRIPAAFCGIAGIKPSEHRWSNLGSETAIAGQETIRAQIGPLGRTVDDLVLLMRALPSPLHAELDPFVPPVPFGDPSAVDPSRLRIGFYDDDGFFTPAASVRRAVRQTVDALRAAGAHVEPYVPPDVEEAVYLYFSVLSADGAVTLERKLAGERVIAPLATLRRLARMPDLARRAAARAMAALGESRVSKLLDAIGRKRVDELWALTARRTRLRLGEMEAWRRAELDAVICPITTTPALRHGDSHDFALGAVHAMRYNLLNLPAGVVPVTRVRRDETARPTRRDRLDKKAAAIEAESAGLPIAVQVVARPYREDVALAVMKVIESAARSDPSHPALPVDPAGG